MERKVWKGLREKKKNQKVFYQIKELRGDFFKKDEHLKYFFGEVFYNEYPLIYLLWKEGPKRFSMHNFKKMSIENISWRGVFCNEYPSIEVLSKQVSVFYEKETFNRSS